MTIELTAHDEEAHGGTVTRFDLTSDSPQLHAADLPWGMTEQVLKAIGLSTPEVRKLIDQAVARRPRGESW